MRLINVIKIWDHSRLYDLMTLLQGYLLGNPTTEAHQQLHSRVVEGINAHIATLS